MYQTLNNIIKFLASLWCAVALIVGVAVIVAVGTFIESSHGADAAQILIYQTPWFAVILVLLSLNLLLSAISRWPWKKKHIGFLTTHLGIIFILVGSLITQRFGVDGQMAITEGESGNKITLLKPVLEIISPSSGKRWMLPMKPHALTWEGSEKILSDKKIPFELTLTKEYPKAKQEEVVRKAVGASPAIRFRLNGMMGEFHEWLFLNDPERSSMAMGAATVRFSNEPIKLEPQQKKKEPEGALVFQFNSGIRETLPIPLDGRKKKLKLKEQKLEVTIVRILKDAIVEGNQLVDRSKEWKNPAIEFTLEGNGFKEEHVAFSNFPEFPTLHGMKPSAAGVQIQFKMDGQTATLLGKNELRFVYRHGQAPRYQIKKGDSLTEGDVKLNEEIVTGWMDFRFLVTDYLDGAEIEKKYVPALGNPESGVLRVIELEMSRQGQSDRFWLVQGEAKHLTVGSQQFHLIYGLETIPLGFNLELKDFSIDTDPGTEKPASFKSDVIMRDPMRGIEREVTIQMNEPLIHRGYSVYQSAYQIQPGQPDVSIFTIAKDPGIWIKYLGAIVMVLGMVFFFFVKELSTVKSVDPKVRKL